MASEPPASATITRSKKSSGKKPISKPFVPSSSEEDSEEEDIENTEDNVNTNNTNAKKKKNELMTVNMDDLDNLLSKPRDMYYAKKSTPTAKMVTPVVIENDSDPLDGPTTCHLCHKSFKKNINLQLHMEKVHDMNSKPLIIEEDEIPEAHKCSQCPREFITETALEKHLIDHERNLIPVDIAPQVTTPKVEKSCEEFSINIQSHVNLCLQKPAVVHKGPPKENEVKATCPHCKQTFRRLYNMKTHINRVHNKVKPFKCERCDKSFATNSDLKQHLGTHGAGKMFKCELCDRE